MTILLNLRPQHRLLAGALWLCAATGGGAVSLGPNTRSAVSGQPLDLFIQTMLDAGDDPKALCLEADVFYADRQLDPSQVRVSAQKPAEAQPSLIHIHASVPVEGPVVTVHLRAGCAQKTARRYVVMAAAKARVQVLPGDGAQQVDSLAATVEAPLPGALPDQGKIQAMDAELRQLREDLLKTQSILAENKAQLQQTESDRFRKELVYGLIGILSFAFAGLLFLWRQRPGVPAFGGREPGPSTGSPVSTGTEMDIDESLFNELKRRPAPSSLPMPDAVPPLPRRDRARFSVSVPYVLRTVKVPELFDLQQQVEFFSSLGQQEKAIALLRKHLVDNVKTSALVYLDLLDLYHQTGNRASYEVLRADFNRVFNAEINPFDRYAATRFNASALDAVLARIQAVWPGRGVFDVIDDALFREPGNPEELLDLEACRELLLLHAIAREIMDLEPGLSQASDSRPLSSLAMQPPSSPRLGLDIDLSQIAGSGGRAVDMAEHRARAAAAGPRSTDEPTVFDSLVDFDDYDTGFRPDDLGKPG